MSDPAKPEDASAAPTGAPQPAAPAPKVDDGIGKVTAVTAVLVIGGGLFVVAAMATPTLGARRSVRLEFEARQCAAQAEVNAALEKRKDKSDGAQEESK